MAHRFLAVHPSNTLRKRLPDTEGGIWFSFGFWPPSVEDDLRARLRDVSVFNESKQLSTEELANQNRIDSVHLTEAARWSVRGWEAEPAAIIEDVELFGKKHQRLADESLELLRANRLLMVVGVHAVMFNMLGPEGKAPSAN